MSAAPTPGEIFQRAIKEGRRRIDQSLPELAATSFIAGFTIVIAILALGAAHGASEPQIGSMARIPGSLAFGFGLALLVAQRAELFAENFFDPVATVFTDRRRTVLAGIARLWLLTLVFSLVGGLLMAWVVSTGGMVPESSREALASIAEELARRSDLAHFVSAIVGGALVALLSYALAGANSVFARIAMAYGVGVLLALGQFGHVVVTAMHLVMGSLAGADIPTMEILRATGYAVLGNVVGGVGLVTLSHGAQAKG